MALGFNQAGLLFATSRKSVVERKAMGIANDKIALARESQALSEDYARGQNLRKLVWEDAQGVQNDLRFSTITAPFATGNTNYIMTNVGGKMIVDSAMMKRFGLTEDTGFLTMSRGAFLSQFADPYSDPVTNINPDDYPPKPGIALPPNERDSMKVYTSMDKDYLSDFKTDFDALINMSEVGRRKMCQNGDSNPQDIVNIRETTARLMEINTVWKDSAEQALMKLGQDPTSTLPIKLPNNNKKRIEQYRKEYNHFVEMDKNFKAIMWFCDNNWGGDSDYPIDSKKAAINFIVHGNSTSWSVKGNGFFGAGGDQEDAANFINDGLKAAGINMTISRKSNYEGKLWDRNNSTNPLDAWSTLDFPGSKGGGTENSITTQDYVDYYDTIWKHLTYKGWVKEDRVNDPKFLENSLRSGGIYMEKQDVGYSFSRVAWQTDPTCALRDVRDKTGVNLAQVQYEQRKAQLDGKESNLDVDLRNLDMERAALDAQIDTLKAVITKNVERSFKMFQA